MKRRSRTPSLGSRELAAWEKARTPVPIPRGMSYQQAPLRNLGSVRVSFAGSKHMWGQFGAQRPQ
jgi:hypothetical protein